MTTHLSLDDNDTEAVIKVRFVSELNWLELDEGMWCPSVRCLKMRGRRNAGIVTNGRLGSIWVKIDMKEKDSR